MKLLKIDMDWHPPDKWMKAWLASREWMLDMLGCTAKKYRVFKTKRGMHVYFNLYNDVTAEEANYLQFMLGDDYTRVKINQWRIQRGIKRWNKLFHRVLYRRKPKTLSCYYCGNVIPVPDRWFKGKIKT